MGDNTLTAGYEDGFREQKIGCGHVEGYIDLWLAISHAICQGNDDSMRI